MAFSHVEGDLGVIALRKRSLDRSHHHGLEEIPLLQRQCRQIDRRGR